ncbi:MAG: FHA domain-containing protein [Planctomycetes bacterium]|nr:FHA domain-containing protein [Planctomycetota bacterium]
MAQTLRLTRVDNLTGLEEYVLFTGAAPLGSDPSCPIHLAHPSVSPFHAQVLWLGQSFWLEPLQANRPTRVGGKPVSLDHLVPLRPEMAVRVGEVEVAVAAYAQFFLDFTPGH